jgi:type II secretory pathway component PulM
VQSLRVLCAQAWAQRSRRERAMLSAMALGLALAGFVEGLWLPVQDALQRRRPVVAQLDGEARRMAQMQRELARLASSAPLALRPAQSWMPEVIATAREMDFPLQAWSLMPQGDNLKMQGLGDFDQWLRFAAGLEQRYAISVRQLQVQAGGESGWVRVDAVLGRGKAAQ